MLKSERFRFVGANAEYLPYAPDWAVESVLDRAKGLGMSVIRTWGFGEGCDDYSLENCEAVSPYFQPQQGVYNPMAFRHFDRIVYEAGKRKIRLIVPLVNNWYEHGGIPRYVCWKEEKEQKNSSCDVRTMSDQLHDSFYKDPEIRTWYEDYVKHFVTHVNTITGVSYAEDPTIMAWELINEPRAKSDPTGKLLHDWISDMSIYLNSLAPNQMIGTGEEGWYILNKDDADQYASWQTFNKNYWHYGVNWQDSSCLSTWGSNGTDFISDNSTEDRLVQWQKAVGILLSSPVNSIIRDGVPNIDFTGIHLYPPPLETNLARAPYCYFYGLDSLCSSSHNTTNPSDPGDLSYTGDLAPVHQAKEWILQHVTDAHQRLHKPFILEEFNFPVATNTPLGSQSNKSGNSFEVTPEERAQLFRQYMDSSYDMDVDGIMFWNLGYDGFMQQDWNEIDALKKWTASSGDKILADTTGVLLKYTLDPTQLDASMELTDPKVDWLRAEGNPLMVDIVNDGDAQQVVFDVKFAGNSALQSRAVRLKPGENSFILNDLFNSVESSQSKTACPQPKEDAPLVVNFKVTVKGFSKDGEIHLKFNTIFNNRYVIFPGDPVEEVIQSESTRWTQNNAPVLPRAQIDHRITCSDKPINPEIIGDAKLPIQFYLSGGIEHPDGYYYRYYVSGPKGQEDLGFGSVGLSRKGTIWVHANTLGKYEVKIAPEGESFTKKEVGDSCHFEVGNASPVINIDNVKVDGVNYDPSYGAIDINHDASLMKHTIEIQVSGKDDVSDRLRLDCRLLAASLDLGHSTFTCQPPTPATTKLGQIGSPVIVSGSLLPGNYELQLWAYDKDGDKSAISRLYITVPIPLYAQILGIVLLLATGILTWKVGTRPLDGLYSRKRLRRKAISSSQPQLTAEPTRLPNTGLGFTSVLLLMLLSAIGAYRLFPAKALAMSSIVVGAASLGYWFFCLFKIHRFLQEITHGTYPIGPGKAVWLHLIPVYDLFWIFRWSSLLTTIVNEGRTQKINKAGPGILTLLGFMLSTLGIMGSLESDGISMLSLGALGFLLLYGVINFLGSELSQRDSDVSLVNSHKGSYRLGSWLAEYQWFTLWCIGNLLVLLPPFFAPDELMQPVWLLVGLGVIQQVLISFRKPQVMWWAVCYFLSWVLGMALFSSFSGNTIFRENQLAEPIVAGVLIGAITGFFQWLILRKTQIAGTAWWIVVCIFSTPMLMGFLLQDQPFLHALLMLIYCLVTGLAMEGLLSAERDGATRWTMFRQRFWGLQGAFLIIYLLATSYVSSLAWGNRLLSRTFVEISSTEAWQDTNLRLNKGNRAVFQYSNGTWSIDPLNSEDGRFTDADGIPGSTPQKYCEGCDAPLPTGTLGMLVATQDTSRLGVPVGNYLVYIAPQDAELYMTMNDSFEQFFDNSGSIIVKIQIYNR